MDVLMGGPGAESEVIAVKPADDKVDRYDDDWAKACRCYRCGVLLTLETLTVDCIVPRCQGGTYRRNNIRPSCADCANKQGAELRHAPRKAKR